MTPFQLHIYLCEVEMQCEFSLAAAESVNEFFNPHRNRATGESERAVGADADRGHNQVFRSLHSFLTHAAVASRILWPSTPRKGREEDRASHDQRLAHAENRGKQVRLALGLLDDQPAGQRALRDHLEHFDERLDDWVLAGNRHTYTDHRLGPPNSTLSPEQLDVMRWFDQTDGSFYFRGERFDLRALATWVKEIRGLAAHARRYGPGLRPLSDQHL